MTPVDGMNAPPEGLTRSDCSDRGPGVSGPVSPEIFPIYLV